MEQQFIISTLYRIDTYFEEISRARYMFRKLHHRDILINDKSTT